MSAEGLSAHVGCRQKDSLCWCMKPLSKLTGVESQALLVDTRETNPYKYSLVRFVGGEGGGRAYSVAGTVGEVTGRLS